VIVAELPQASTAINVLICDALQLVVDTEPSLDDIVGMPQPSVAVADPNAAVISEACGLQPRVTLVYEPVNAGGVISAVHVTVLVTVVVLPQPSTAVKVLVCDEEQLVFCTVPSVKLIVGVAQPSVAAAEPRAAVISVACGLQPRVTLL
jgi:hypothetical protein